MQAFVVELQNQPGELAKTLSALVEHGINVTGVAGVGSGDCGAVAFLTSDDAATRMALTGIGAAFHQVDCVTTTLVDEPGSLAAVADRLASAKINVELVTPVGMDGGRVRIAIGVDNMAAAERALGG